MPPQENSQVRKIHLLLLTRDMREIFKSNKPIALYPSMLFSQQICTADGDAIAKQNT